MNKVLAAVSLAILLVAGCDSGGAPTGTPAASPTQAGQAVTCMPDAQSGDVSATIIDFGFQPAQISASAGQSVAWTNDGAVPHTVTFDDGPDCGQLSSGESLAAQFGQAGEYAFHCAIHPTMRGTVTIGN